MNWQEFRLTTRLGLNPDIVESVYRMIAEIDSVKTSWKLTGTLLPQTIERLTHSVLVTSTGASNRIEANKADYYIALNKAQKSWNTRKEDISEWLLFFLKIVQAQSRQAVKILEGDHFEYLLGVQN